MAEQDFTARFAELVKEIEALEDSADAKLIEETASRLEGLKFTVPVITPLGCFLRFNRQGLLDEAERIRQLDAVEACAAAPGDAAKCEDLRLQHITVLLFYYRKLLALRAGSSAEWDEVDELYVHD